MFLVAEIFRNGQSRQSDAQTRPGRLGHLSIDQSAARLFAVARHDDAAFAHFQPKVVTFASALTYACEYRHAAVLHCDVVNQFHNQNGLADTRAAEEANLSALYI